MRCLGSAVIGGCIAIQDLLVPTMRRDADAVMVAWHRCEIADTEDQVFLALALPEERDTATSRDLLLRQV